MSFGTPTGSARMACVASADPPEPPMAMMPSSVPSARCLPGTHSQVATLGVDIVGERRGCGLQSDLAAHHDRQPLCDSGRDRQLLFDYQDRQALRREVAQGVEELLDNDRCKSFRR